MLAIIIIAVFLIPISSIFTIPGTIVWYPQLLALQFIGGLCFASKFWKLNKFLSIFLAYLVFSYVYVTGASPRTLLCLMIGFMAISVTLVVSELRNLKWIYNSLIFMSILSVIYAVLQSFGIDPIFLPIGDKSAGIVSFMGSHNQLGAFSAANAFWMPWIAPLAVIPIFLAKCNSAFIGLICGFGIYIWQIYGKKAISIFILCILVLLVPWWHFNKKSNQEIMERINIWKLSITDVARGTIDESLLDGKKQTVKASPFFGFGLSNFFSFSPMSQYKIWGLKATDNITGKQQHFYEHAHNDLVEALYEFGYTGFGIIIFIIGSIVLLFINSPKTNGVIITFSSLVAQAISSLGIYIFHAPVSLFIFCLTLGLFYAEVKNAKSR